MSDYTSKSVGSAGIGPRTRQVSAFPGAPGVPGGVPSTSPTLIQSGVVGQSDPLDGGSVDTPISAAFPGNGAAAETGISTAGQAWQAGWQAEDMPVLNPSTINSEPGHVSGGIRMSHPEAFPGGGQAG